MLGFHLEQLPNRKKKTSRKNCRTDSFVSGHDVYVTVTVRFSRQSRLFCILKLKPFHMQESCAVDHSLLKFSEVAPASVN